jgi:GMP synthase-like glutamine amidotransferase
MRILCLRHVPFEGLGELTHWARHREHELCEAYASREMVLPPPFDMLVVLGGPMNAMDDEHYPWLVREREFIAHAVEDGKLVLGICLGAQLLAAALGGRVFRNPEPEIGWFPVTLTDTGRHIHVFDDWPETFTAGHWHSDTFEPPEHAPIIAVSQACMRQGFALDRGRVVGLQFHLEWTPNTLMRMVEACPEDFLPGHPFIHSGERMLAHPDLCTDTRGLLFSLLDRMEALR